MFEKIFEGALWRSRFFVILAVIFSMIGSILMFIVASVDIYGVAAYIIDTYSSGAHPKNFHEIIVGGIIGAVDLYLIAVVLLIFSFGLYELFISDIDEASKSNSKVLEIHSLDQLKNKLANVIVMVLIVSFFKRVMHAEYNGALELFYYALSILALALGLYFLSKGGKK